MPTGEGGASRDRILRTTPPTREFANAFNEELLPAVRALDPCWADRSGPFHLELVVQDTFAFDDH